MVELRKITQYANSLSTKFKNAVVSVSHDLHDVILDLSPVKTGKYKINNRIAFNEAPTNVLEIDKVKNPSDFAEKEARKASLQEKAPADLERVILFNNVDYSHKLEAGYSKQAPNGVYGPAILDVEGKLAVELKKLGLL